MDNKLSKTESKLSGGIASAMAMTGLPQAYTPGASMASIGGGTYNGESAVALGVSMVSANGRWSTNYKVVPIARVNTPPHSVPVFSGNDPLS